MSHDTNPFVLILVNSIISSFSRTLIIVFWLALSHNVDIDSLITKLSWDILTLVSSIDTADCVCTSFSSSFFTRIMGTTDTIDASSTDCVLIRFLVLDKSTKVLHLLGVYVRT